MKKRLVAIFLVVVFVLTCGASCGGKGGLDYDVYPGTSVKTLSKYGEEKGYDITFNSIYEDNYLFWYDYDSAHGETDTDALIEGYIREVLGEIGNIDKVQNPNGYYYGHTYTAGSFKIESSLGESGGRYIHVYMQGILN